MKSLSDRRGKENGRLIDDRRSTRGNRFATDDRAMNKKTVGLSDGPPVLEAPPNPEVDRCLELRWAPRRARVGVSDRRALLPRRARWSESSGPTPPAPWRGSATRSIGEMRRGCGRRPMRCPGCSRPSRRRPPRGRAARDDGGRRPARRGRFDSRRADRDGGAAGPAAGGTLDRAVAAPGRGWRARVSARRGPPTGPFR